MSLKIPKKLETAINRMIRNYPQKRSASLMVLHAIQEHEGFISPEAVEWVARKLDLQPINVHELVTFYPMFRQQAAGRHVVKICRTLSCALAGADGLRKHLCRKLGLDEQEHHLQTTEDGRFSIESVECLAGCGVAPVMMCDDEFHEGVTPEKADEILKDKK